MPYNVYIDELGRKTASDGRKGRERPCCLWRVRNAEIPMWIARITAQNAASCSESVKVLLARNSPSWRAWSWKTNGRSGYGRLSEGGYWHSWAQLYRLVLSSVWSYFLLFAWLLLFLVGRNNTPYWPAPLTREWHFSYPPNITGNLDNDSNPSLCDIFKGVSNFKNQSNITPGLQIFC